MKKNYLQPALRAIEIGSEEDVMQLITTSKGTETYDDDDDDPADEPALVRRNANPDLWADVW